MTKLSQNIKKIAKGYLLIFLHFNINSWDLLPDFLGYILIVQATIELSDELPELKLIEKFGIFLVTACAITWVINGLYVRIENTFGVLMTLVQVIRLTFDFILLTNLYRLALKYDCEEAPRILLCRSVIIILNTVLAVQTWLVHSFENDFITGFTIFTLFVNFVFAIRLIYVLYCFASSIQELEIKEATD